MNVAKHDHHRQESKAFSIYTLDKILEKASTDSYFNAKEVIDFGIGGVVISETNLYILYAFSPNAGQEPAEFEVCILN